MEPTTMVIQDQYILFTQRLPFLSVQVSSAVAVEVVSHLPVTELAVVPLGQVVTQAPFESRKYPEAHLEHFKGSLESGVTHTCLQVDPSKIYPVLHLVQVVK